MLKRVSIIIIAIIASILFISNSFLFTQEAHAYNKPWDQGHDSTNPEEPEEPEEPPEPPCDECQTVCYLSPVSCSDGNYIYKAQDLFITGNMPLELTRIYNSRDNMRTSFFGYGWVSTIDMKLVYVSGDTENLAKILMPNGQRYDFVDNADGTFTPPLGVYQTLTKNTDETYTLKEKDGDKYEFGANGSLTRMVNKNNYQIIVSYDNSGCPNILVT